MNRKAPERRDTAVGNAAIEEVLIADADLCGRREQVSRGGVQAIAFIVDAITIAAGPVIEARQAQRDTIRNRMVGVDGTAEQTEAATFQARFKAIAEVSLARHAVDQTTGGAATEDHRVGAFQHFHALDVVDLTEILDVISHAVEEEVAGGGDASEHGGVAVAFTLRELNARDIPHGVLHARHGAVRHFLLGHNADRLGNVDERGIGFGRGGRAFRDIGVDRRVGYAHRCQHNRLGEGGGSA